jgi:hypothetical protein
MIYYLYKTESNLSQPNAVYTVDETTNSVSFFFDPNNTDYANFKKEVLAGVELQDDTGNVMTDAAEYVRTLP